MPEPRDTITIRLGADERAEIDRAAELERKRTGEFIRDAAVAAAKRVIARKERD